MVHSRHTIVLPGGGEGNDDLVLAVNGVLLYYNYSDSLYSRDRESL